MVRVRVRVRINPNPAHNYDYTNHQKLPKILVLFWGFFHINLKDSPFLLFSTKYIVPGNFTVIAI